MQVITTEFWQLLKSARIFWFEQLLFNKFDFGASDFEAAVLLQIEVKWKMLGWSVTFKPKSVEKHFQRGTLKNLMTPCGQFAVIIVIFWEYRPTLIQTPSSERSFCVCPRNGPLETSSVVTSNLHETTLRCFDKINFKVY